MMAAAPTAGSQSVEEALDLCRPKLAERVSGDISSILVNASLALNGWTVIRGPMRALIGMGEPSPGHASAAHLIRVDYDFICWVNNGRVRKLVINRAP